MAAAKPQLVKPRAVASARTWSSGRIVRATLAWIARRANRAALRAGGDAAEHERVAVVHDAAARRRGADGARSEQLGPAREAAPLHLEGHGRRAVCGRRQE